MCQYIEKEINCHKEHFLLEGRRMTFHLSLERRHFMKIEGEYLTLNN